MLNSYHRRAFLALAVFALEPIAVTTAQAEEPETLWETLNHVDRKADAKTADNTDPDEPIRVPLGAVPGFTLPTMERVNDKSTSSKQKSYRGPFAPFSRIWDKFMSSTGSNIDVKGDTSLAFRSDKISGGTQATQTFQDQNYFGQGSNGLYTNASMHVDATLFKYLHYSSTISNSPYRSPGENRVKFDYKSADSKTRLQVGDINAGFQGNSLIDFNRYLSGVEVQNEWTKQFKTAMLYSRTKSETKTLTTPGNDSAGPYYLFSGQIVDGSAHVRVDNRDLAPGKDYTLDPNTGELHFLNGNVILHSQTIALTYETQGYNLSQGTIYGFRTQYTPHGATSAGLTYVTQQTRSIQQFTPRKQQFQGVEAAFGQYQLDAPIDTTKPFNVLVNGVPLVRGSQAVGDYFIDSVFPNVIHIRQPVPSIETVIIEYVALDTNPNPGNRSVLGFDGHIGVGKFGSLSLETALSGLDLTGKTYGGKAAQLRADLTPLRNLTTHITMRQVGATYSSVQTPGFNRNEKSLELAGDYSPSSKLHFNYEWQKALRPSYSYASGTTNSQFSIISRGNDTYKQYNLGASYEFLRGARVSLVRNSLGTDYIAGGSSNSISDTLGLNWGFRSFSIEAALSRNLADTNSLNGSYLDTSLTGTGANATTSGAYTAHTSTLTRRLGMNWQPIRWLHLDSSISDNDIHNTGSGYAGLLAHTNATDRQISARLTPISRLTLLYSYDLSDTGTANGTTTIGATTGTATGTSTGTATGTTATGATTGSTGVTGTGVANTRSFFRPWTFATTRDSVTGATVGSTNTGFGTTATTSGITTVAGVTGGGTNYNLGSSGSYSGYLGNNLTSSSYGVTSLGGRNSTNRVGLDYSFKNGMHVNLGYDTSNSVGDYQYNSRRNNSTLGFNWNPSDRYAFNGNFNIQKVAYTGSLGGTNSSSYQFGFTGRPFGTKFTTSISMQNVRTKSALNLNSLSSSASSTGATASATTAGATAINPLYAAASNADTNLNSLSLRLDYPISRRHTLFVDWLSSTATGYLGNSESDMRFGMDIYLNQILKFSLGWQTVNRVNKDSSLANYNYHSSSLLAEFGLHF